MAEGVTGRTPGARTLLRGGRIADGTGGPLRTGELLIEGGRIRAVGQRVDPVDAEIVDLDGLVLAPGFIDVHTHYDAQVLWDPDLTPSSWHGVTTVLMGNCGFGIAPTRPELHDVIVRTLEKVEGMSYEALSAGIPWDFSTFEEYLDVIEALPKRCNVQAFLGHTPLRLAVMGMAAYEREATEHEIRQMAEVAAGAVGAGAVGLSSSRGNLHFGVDGRPVPSRFAATDELAVLLRTVTVAGGRLNQVATGGGLLPEDALALARKTDSPLVWTPIVADAQQPGGAVERVRRLSSPAERIWAQFPCRQVVMQMQLLDPYPFAPLPAFRSVIGSPPALRAEQYRRLLTDPVALAEIEQSWNHRWHKVFVAESTSHDDLVDRSIAELARERSIMPAELLIRTALDEDLTTRFRVVLANDGVEEIGELLAMDEPVLGLSDAGAHADQLCDAGFATDLLGRWVRDRGALSLEHAIWRLTGHIADVVGLHDRGRLAPGLAADLVAFDADRVGAGPLERVRDLPAGADRLVSRSVGIEHIWIGGVRTRQDGTDLAGVHPGRLLRSGCT